jgi:hypothetical protein
MAVTFAYETTGYVKRVIVDWVSDASGDAAGTSAKIEGTLIKAVTVPSSTAAPTDNYDIVITDDNGVNVLANCIDDLMNRHTTNTQEIYCLVSSLAATDPGGAVHPVVSNPLTITIDEAGNAKAGKLILYYRTV